VIRDDIKAALVTAMKSGDKAGTQTIRLIQSWIKNRDIELRTSANAPDDNLLVTEVLQKMIKQRRESVDLYRKGNREELAAAEEAEIAVIERFLPAQMDEAEAMAAVQSIIAETGAVSMKDMGRVMALVKERHATSIEPGAGECLGESCVGLIEKSPAAPGRRSLKVLRLCGGLLAARCHGAKPRHTFDSQPIKADRHRAGERTGHTELEIAHDGAELGADGRNVGHRCS
jgi:uncharacterized protein YqeY